MSKPVLGYWDIRGLTQPIRFLLQFLGVDYEDKTYENANPDNTWFSTDKSSLGLDFPNLPYWIDENVKLTETKAILKYLARKYNPKLIPSEEPKLMQSDVVENVLSDIWKGLIQYCYINTDQIKETFAQDMKAKFDQLSKFMGSNAFILGNEITFVDFFMYEILYHYSVWDAEFLKPYGNLQKFKRTFESIPSISEYINGSPNYRKGPCFSVHAIVKI